MTIYEYKTKLLDSKLFTMEVANQYEVDHNSINSSRNAAEVFTKGLKMQEMAEEHMYCVCLNAAAEITAVFECNMGGFNECPVSTREVARKALMMNAISVIVAHNHPSGNTNPSEEDFAATKKLAETLDIVGITLLDHIIVAGRTGNYITFREEGYNLK